MTSNVRPQLVIDHDTGAHCMQIRIGSFTATAELPPDIRSWPTERLQEFMDANVPAMITKLHEMRRTDQRRLRRDLKRESDS